VLYLADLSDGSGQLSPTVSWQPWDYLRVSFGLGWAYGEQGDELVPNGSTSGNSLGATLGGGKFYLRAESPPVPVAVRGLNR